MTEKKHWRDSMTERNQDWIKNHDKPKGGSWQGGKGSSSRVSDTATYRDNWDKIFGGDKNGTSTTEEPTE